MLIPGKRSRSEYRYAVSSSHEANSAHSTDTSRQDGEECPELHILEEI